MGAPISDLDDRNRRKGREGHWRPPSALPQLTSSYPHTLFLKLISKYSTRKIRNLSVHPLIACGRRRGIISPLLETGDKNFFETLARFVTRELIDAGDVKNFMLS